MNSNFFVSAVLIVVSALMITFYHFKEHFSGADYFKSKAYVLKEKVQDEQLQALLAQHQLAEFQQHVATVLPDLDFKGLSHEQKYPYRNLASLTTQYPKDHFREKTAAQIFEEGREAFARKEFRSANQSFRKIIDDFPSSINVIRAHFLLIEGLYHLREFEGLTAVTNNMVTLFPEDELTGHALIRLASVYEREERPDDAGDILDTVLKIYKDKKLRVQAMQKKRALR